MTTVEEFAPAKVNLTLHVTGRRADGYHLLDSLVMFADVGDRISAQMAAETALEVTGPHAEGIPTDMSNLVFKAAGRFSKTGARLTLEKHLPPASGIGGGSADAAATLRALSRLWDIDLPDADAVLALGADVPVCLYGRSVRMSGVGEILTPASTLPQLDAVLINPGIEVSTPLVFKTLMTPDNAPMPDVLPAFSAPVSAIDWIATQRNDLEPPALAVAPVIVDVLTALSATPGCRLARMSGSGATCFGLFENRAAAKFAEARLRKSRPDWWIVATQLG